MARSTANLDTVARAYTRKASLPRPMSNSASSFPSATCRRATPSRRGPTVTYWNGDDPATFEWTCATDKGVQRISATVQESSTGRSRRRDRHEEQLGYAVDTRRPKSRFTLVELLVAMTITGLILAAIVSRCTSACVRRATASGAGAEQRRTTHRELVHDRRPERV